MSEEEWMLTIEVRDGVWTCRACGGAFEASSDGGKVWRHAAGDPGAGSQWRHACGVGATPKVVNAVRFGPPVRFEMSGEERELLERLSPAHRRDDAEIARLRRELERARELLRRATITLGNHAHWDPSMQSGAGCPVCMGQRALRHEISVALADPGPDGGGRGTE